MIKVIDIIVCEDQGCIDAYTDSPAQSKKVINGPLCLLNVLKIE